tara:strand:- start:251 stop:499 length:249 start_codon:yes stop_codon:yes gene_type:complete
MKFLMLIIFIFSSVSIFAQTKRKTVIKYQKRQKIDLGAMMIGGEIVSPGDFSIEDEKEKAQELLFKRKKYNDRLDINIQYVF